MEKNRQRSIIALAAILIAALIIGLLSGSVSLSKSRKDLQAEKQTSEKLLSEKLSIEKELKRLKTDFASLRQRDFANQKVLDETNVKIAEFERRIGTLTSENRTLRTDRKELESLRKVRADIQLEAERLRSEYDNLVAENIELRNSLSEAEMNYVALQQEIAQSINSDNFLVTATRGKKTERIVIRASRAKKLNMAFEIPQHLSDAISFRLTTPSGSTVNADDKSLSWAYPEYPGDLTASLSAETGEFEKSMKVVMSYAPKDKLAKGEYKIQIFSGTRNIGNCRLLLR